MERTWQFAASVAPAGKSARFAGIAYSGGLIPAWNAVIDLLQTRVEQNMPVMLSHDRDRVIGVVDQYENDGAALRLSGLLHADIDEDAAQIIAKARAGQRWQMSVGLHFASETLVPAGKSATVNGRTFAGPVVVLGGGTVRECSIVALGADPQTSVRCFAHGTPAAREHRSPLVAQAEARGAAFAALRGGWR